MHTLWVIRTQCMMCITCVLYTEKRSSSYEWSPGWIFHNPHKCRLERVKKNQHIYYFHLYFTICYILFVSHAERAWLRRKKNWNSLCGWKQHLLLFFCMFQFFFFFLSRSSSNDATDRVSMPNIAPKNRLFLRIYFFFSRFSLVIISSIFLSNVYIHNSVVYYLCNRFPNPETTTTTAAHWRYLKLQLNGINGMEAKNRVMGMCASV